MRSHESNNKRFLRLAFWVALVAIILVYSGFISYYCMAKPGDPNSSVVKLSKTTQKTNPIKSPNPHVNKILKNGIPPGKTVKPEQYQNTPKTVSSDVYLCEMTDFYELMITLLLSVIGIILVVSFLYIHRTSRLQAEEMAALALESKSFKIILNNMIAKGADEFIEMYSGIPNLEKRVDFLEVLINKQGYELDDPEDTVEAG